MSKTKLCILIIFSVVLLYAEVGKSLILIGGDEPIEDHGWLAGSVDLANLPTRLSWWAGPPFGTGSMYEFEYRCKKTSEFNQALRTFAAIRVDRLELVVHNGPKIDWSNDDKRGRIDWTFRIWNPKDWDRLKNTSRSFYRVGESGMKKPVPMAKKPVPAPKVEVYIGGDCPIDWKDVEVPENVEVVDKRPGSAAAGFAGKGLIRGKVFDLETKKPITEATIVLLKRVEVIKSSTGGSEDSHSRSYEWKKLMETTTDSGGYCQIDKISLGLYHVQVLAGGYAPAELEAYDNRRPEYYGFEAGLLRSFDIKGIVVDTEGSTLEGVSVSARDFIGADGNEYPLLEESPVVTNAQGKFEILDLPKGFASLRCRAEGLHQADSIFEMYPVPSKEIKLTVSGTGTIRGKVLGRNGKPPVGDIHIHIRPPGEQIGKWGGSARCKEDGSFEFSGVPPGKYLIGADISLATEGDRTNAKLVLVEAGKTYDIEIVHVEQRRRR